MAFLILPIQQIIRELHPDGWIIHAILTAYVFFRTMQHHILSLNFFREKNNIPVVQYRRGQPSQSLKLTEISSNSQPRVTQILTNSHRRIAATLRQQNLIMSEIPILPWRVWTISISDVILRIILHDTGIFHTTGVRPVLAGTKCRHIGHALKVKSILTGRQPQTNDVLGIISRSPIQHIERTVVIYYPRVTSHQRFPIIRIRRGKYRISLKFL